ncbi:MAG: type I 3-dehydroquinate dehydratase [Eubacteriales bacterium]|nr:type I 3-dehydroquinate dehydratase [Eubacteriales bacterium]
MKPSFVIPHKRPLLVSMITETLVADCIIVIRNSIFDGADAFALHLDHLDPKHINEEDLKRIMNYCCDKPVLSINYRKPNKNSLSDEDLVETHFTALKAGATMCDIMGDMYEPSPMQLAKSPVAIDKQKKLIDRIHSVGGEVLMSSHTWVMMSPEETVEHAKALESRGVDMIKIAMRADTENELLEVIRTTSMMKRELKIPFLHICMGQYGKLHRVIAPFFGSALVLCVQQYTRAGHKEQPLLGATKRALDNIDANLGRESRTADTNAAG